MAGKSKKLEEIIEGIRRFKKKIGVEKAYLYGSYARGEANKHSDVDVILLSKKFEHKTFTERMKGLWLAWTLDLPVDFLCYTPREFNEQKKQVSIISQAIKEGIEI